MAYVGYYHRLDVLKPSKLPPALRGSGWDFRPLTLMDGMAMVSPTVKPEGWSAFYEDALKKLKPGLTYLIVHLGYNDAELQAVMGENAPFGAAWRQRDFDVLTSPSFAQAIKENGVTLVGWKDLKKLMKKQEGSPGD